MQTWLYLAASSRASAERTYELAYQHGLVWRSVYNVHGQAIPNTGQAEPGDELLLAYRDGAGWAELLGRARVGIADQPLEKFPGFCAAPGWLEAELAGHGYAPDPILGKQVGLFVTDVEPLRGRIPTPNQSRNALQKLSHPPEATEDQRPARPTAEFATSQRSSFPTPTLPALPVVSSGSPTPRRGHEVYVGIDVGGFKKGFDLAVLEFSQGTLTQVRHAALGQQAMQLPPITQLRLLVQSGNVTGLAQATFPAAQAVCHSLWQQIVTLAGGVPSGIFIDSPSAFSRNTLGHGRYTEKASLRGVSFQSSPSLRCNRPHGGDWSWLLYGMMAFAASWTSGSSLTGPAWEQGLAEGFHSVTSGSTACVVRECFPTATVSHLRSCGQATNVSALLTRFTQGTTGPAVQAVQAVQAYLAHGVQGTKVAGNRLFDAADAIIAGLHALPHVSSSFTETSLWPSGTGSARWAGSAQDLTEEGVITLIQ